MHYPVTPTSYNWYEKGNNGSLGSFTSGDTVYLTVESDGTVKYWKNGNLVRTTSTPLVPLALQIANYAQNSTYGGFYNIQHFEGLIWNGSALV
jgi:hypothetical protein